MAAALCLSLLLATSGPIGVRWPPGTLHGFASLSDELSHVNADGELTQELRDETLVVHVKWSFPDGRHVHEHDQFRTGARLAQQRFSWVEDRGGTEQRRFEVDFDTGRASAVTRSRFTHEPPTALVRAEQTLIEKDDPLVIVDVIPRGSARAAVGRRGAAYQRRGP